MRNPDKWTPPEPEGSSGSERPSPRRGALLGLAIIVLLVVGGLLLTQTLRGMAHLQDCVLSGRSNCQ